VLSLVPDHVSSSEELVELVELVQAESDSLMEDADRATFEGLLNHWDEDVRLLAGSSLNLLDGVKAHREQIESMRSEVQAAAERADKSEARTDEVLKTLKETVKLSQQLAEENARLRAIIEQGAVTAQPVARQVVEPDAVLSKAPEVGAVSKPDTRGVIERAVTAYADAWKEHPVLMGAVHFLGLYAATTSGERDEALGELAEAEDSNAALWEDLFASQEEIEALAEANESQALALSEAENRQELAPNPTTEVHIHEAPRLDEDQLDQLGGRVDRAVQTELRTNAKRYRGPKGDRGAKGQAGKQGRAGRNAKTVRTTKHVHHHTTTHLKSEAKPQRSVEVRHTTHTLKPTLNPGKMSAETEALIRMMKDRKK